jgi:hypothetical protein
MIDLNISQERLKSLQKNIHQIIKLGGMKSLLSRVAMMTARQVRARVDKIMAKQLGIKQKNYRGSRINPIRITATDNSSLPAMPDQKSDTSITVRVRIPGTLNNFDQQNRQMGYQEIKVKKHLIHYFNEKKNQWFSENTERGGFISKVNGKKIVFLNAFEMETRKHGNYTLLFERFQKGFGWDKIRHIETDNAHDILRGSGRMKELEDYARKRFEMNVKPAVRCTIAKLKNEPAQGCF